jgi:hypothetical protein
MLNSLSFRGLIEPAQGIQDSSLKEDWAWICVMNKVLHVYSQDFLRETHMDPGADSVRACGDLE